MARSPRGADGHPRACTSGLPPGQAAIPSAAPGPERGIWNGEAAGRTRRLLAHLESGQPGSGDSETRWGANRALAASPKVALPTPDGGFPWASEGRGAGAVRQGWSAGGLGLGAKLLGVEVIIINA